jgi:membrane-bound ClpP family serine protease
MEADRKANRLTGVLGALCLALMVALMVTGGASYLELALVAVGAGLVLSACLLADHRSTPGR